MRMRIEEPTAASEPALVATTGLRIVPEEGGRALLLIARLPRPRLVARILCDASSARVLAGPDLLDRVIETPAVRIEVGAESRLQIAAREEAAIDVGPTRWRHRLDRGLRSGSGRAAVRTDEDGGLLLLGPRRAGGDRLVLGAGERAEIQVMAPRPPRREHLSLRVAHEGRPGPFPAATLPTAEIVAGVAPHADVFALHAYFWREEDARRRPRFSRYRFRRCPWLNDRHEPEDAAGLDRLMTLVRARGMRFLPYFSPRFTAAADPLAELSRLQARWDFDGFYLDGLRGDLGEQVGFMRALRRLLGEERLIYLNASKGPLGDPALVTPAVDAWADLVLRGDSGRGGLDRATFLREAVSGWNRSGTIGLWCHYGSSGLPFPRDRVPSAGDVEAALEAHVRIWRRSFWPGPSARLATFDRRYESGLARLVAAEEASLDQSR